MSTKIVGLDEIVVCRLKRRMLAPEQSRAARAWLDWSQDDLAKRAKVSHSTIRDFEKGRRVPIANNLDAIVRALEEAGIKPVNASDGKPCGITVVEKSGE